jgi:DNA-binding MarR family transcriptional regulator
MSNEKKQWPIDWARKVRGISVTQKCVLFVLASYADEHCQSWPSISTIVAEACVCQTSVSNAINALEKAGLIKRIQNSQHKSSTYQLNLAANAIVSDAIASNTNIVSNAIAPDTNIAADTIDYSGKRYSAIAANTNNLPYDISLKREERNTLASSDKSLSAGSDEKQKPKVPKPAKTSTLPVELSEFSLPVIGDADPEWRVPKQLLDEWQRSYPGVDVPGELRKMRGWLVSNKERRKTKRGISRFCNSWLSKAQDKGSSLGRNQYHPGQPACPTEHQLRMQEERLMAEALYAKRVANGETWEQRHANDAVNQSQVKAVEECEDVYELMENIKRKREQACQ